MITLVLPAALALVTLTQAPAGWDAIYQQGQQLMLDRKTPEAITLYERAAKQHPTFDGAHYALAEAHRAMALELALQGPPADTARRRHLETAATHYRTAVARGGAYRDLAVMYLMMIYKDDELDRPAELVTFARQYVQIRSASAIGHVTLAKALKRLGQETAATTTLLSARTAVAPEEAPLLATSIVDYVANTPSVPVSDTKALIEYALPVIDRALATEPDSRVFLAAKAVALQVQADRVERDPARQQALKTAADQVFDRFRTTSPNRNSSSQPAAPPLAAPPPPPPPPPPDQPAPPGYDAARREAEALIGRRQFAQAAAVYATYIKSHPGFVRPHYRRVAALILAGRSDTIADALNAARAAVPAMPELRYAAAAELYLAVKGNEAISPGDARKLLSEAIALLDDAVTLKKDYWEPVAFKAIVLGTLAQVEPDPAVAKQLLAEADRVQAQATAMRQKK
jgi:tetratricopeptide (TPR) repeat protein